MDKRFEMRIYDKFEHKYWDENTIRQNAEWLLFGEENKENIEIERSTGLKDKNGKLIYEGDICIPAEDMADKAGEVYRAESGAYFIKGRMKSGIEYDFGIYWHHYMYEVIGNIHENADLLEVENESLA